MNINIPPFVVIFGGRPSFLSTASSRTSCDTPPPLAGLSRAKRFETLDLSDDGTSY